MPLSATITDDACIVESDRDIMSPDRFFFAHARKFLRNMPASARISPTSRRNSRFCRQFARQDLLGSDNFGQPTLIQTSGFAYRPVIKRHIGMPYRHCRSTLVMFLLQKP